ncbi:DNA alkylation repair protein [Chryseobacterium sp.]|uniref:DNA alkylation repair protein n=1 Tax=Chryseobacterium sp. TaxID=1871047 RepID=UPI00388E2C03
MKIVHQIIVAIDTLAIPEKAEFFPRFFKTGVGEYGEGDVFIGVKVPDQRLVAKEFFAKISLADLSILLASPIHEHRSTALFMLVYKFERAKDFNIKEEIVQFYLDHLEFVNNWDLVDGSCSKILGRFAFDNNREDILRKLSTSEVMWHNRIAIVGTMYFVKNGKYNLTKDFITKNLHHTHDLMHKANGWLLREIGNKNQEELIAYLNVYYNQMPRTCLRYAVEKLDEEVRQFYLKGKV